ncbi:alpha/beta fold hydrolase [Kordiimonas lacus]|uniref:Esterase n=1 Tax=Kordiimonas lacus TaxID=637679 RepID=A0A1G7DFW6_9PROT|nr:alpha/beta fold hydrolase [Kordiimonas lacus]SDE50488.1 esterase [Kordiimonas lacus]
MDLFYRTRGDGPPLVMLHGLFGSGDNLGGLARAMENEFRMVMVDHRNHGRSPHVPTNSYGEMAEDILDVMDREGIDKAHVFGHSMGGKVAMQMALLAPDRVDRMVVGDISPVAYSHHHDTILEGMGKVADAAPQDRAGAEAILTSYVQEPDVLSFLLTNWRRGNDGTWRWRLNIDAIRDDYGSISAAVEGDPVDTPVLFLRGGDSDYVTAEHRDTILKLFPNATVRTVEGTGHWLHAEKPDLVARVITRFLKDEL